MIPISLRSILILSSYLHLGLPNCLFPSGFESTPIFLYSGFHIIEKCNIYILSTDEFTGVLHLNQEVLLKLDFIHGAQFLTKLPDDLAADQLFKSIESIHMNVGKQKFGEVLAHHIDMCEEDPS